MYYLNSKQEKGEEAQPWVEAEEILFAPLNTILPHNPDSENAQKEDQELQGQMNQFLEFFCSWESLVC